jgi:hypothetical protein
MPTDVELSRIIAQHHVLAEEFVRLNAACTSPRTEPYPVPFSSIVTTSSSRTPARNHFWN